MTSSHYDLDRLGHTCATKVITKCCNYVNKSKSIKNNRSSNCFLKFENIKKELLVIVNKNVTVNSFLYSRTDRPSRLKIFLSFK